VLSFQGPNGGVTFPMVGVSVDWFLDILKPGMMADIPVSFSRSLTLALVVSLATVAMSVAAGLAFRRNFPGSGLVFYFAVASLVMPSLLVGFGLMFFVQNAVYLAWGADLRGYSFMAEPVDILGARFMANRLLVFGVAVAASLGLLALLRWTMIGKAVRAMMQSPTGAQLVGVDTGILHPVVFGAGLALAGVAGSLLSMVYEISPSMGEPYTITALIVITLGGLGSAIGSLLGGFLLGLVEAFGMHFTNPSLKMVLSYGVLVAVLLARPRGLFAR